MLKRYIAMMSLLYCGAAAASDIDAQTPTFTLHTEGGYSVFKSEMVQSNDTSTTVSYGIAVFGGSDRSVGLLYNKEQTATAFKLNGSSLELAWQDIELRYRLGPVNFGLLASSSSTWIVKAPLDSDGDDVLDPTGDVLDYLSITSAGIGGAIGLAVPINKRSNIYTNVVYVTTQSVHEGAIKDANDTLTQKTTLSLGPRMDVDIGGTLKVTRSLLDVHGGFKMRTYQLTVDDVTYKEQLNTTYFGFRLAWFF